MKPRRMIRGVVLGSLVLTVAARCAAGDHPLLDRWRERRQAAESSPSSTTQGSAPSPGGGTDRDESVTVDGRQRTYYLHLPPGVSPTGSYPLVFNFHGGRGNGHQQAELSKFPAFADRYGFITVAPDGVETNWNDGRGTTKPAQMGIDDVKFVRAVYDKVRSAYAVDPKRVFSTGISNGAMFSYRLACDMSDVFAAIGPVVGSLSSKYKPSCKPGEPVSVVSIMGDADEFVPIQGGIEGWKNGKGDGGELESEASMKDFWSKIDGCSGEPSTSALPNRADDGTSVKKTVISGCKHGAELDYYVVGGGGHTWPPNEVKSMIFAHMMGKSSQNIDATQVIWDFFSKHPKQ